MNEFDVRGGEEGLSEPEGRIVEVAQPAAGSVSDLQAAFGAKVEKGTSSDGSRNKEWQSWEETLNKGGAE